MLGRTLVLTVCLLATWGYLGFAARAEPTPIRAPLSTLPLNLGEFRGRVEPPLTDAVLEILKVDDYTVRSYSKSTAETLGFYVGYHATQRQGASIHSPQNCLPGAGWTPAEQSRLTVNVRDSVGGQQRRIEVNRVVIERGLDRQLVVYWYQSRGRIVASEYWGKVYSVVDAIRYNRSDAALVRIVVPMATPGSDRVGRAEELAVEFVQAVFPRLGDHLPL